MPFVRGGDVARASLQSDGGGRGLSAARSARDARQARGAQPRAAPSRRATVRDRERLRADRERASARGDARRGDRDGASSSAALVGRPTRPTSTSGTRRDWRSESPRRSRGGVAGRNCDPRRATTRSGRSRSVERVRGTCGASRSTRRCGRHRRSASSSRWRTISSEPVAPRGAIEARDMRAVASTFPPLKFRPFPSTPSTFVDVALLVPNDLAASRVESVHSRRERRAARVADPAQRVSRRRHCGGLSKRRVAIDLPSPGPHST